MILYHVLQTQEQQQIFIPKVPESLAWSNLCGDAYFRNADIPRISFYETIKLAVQAAFQKNMWGLKRGTSFMLFSLEMIHPSPTVLIPPKELSYEGLVPEASETGEYWYLQEANLCGIPYIVDSVRISSGKHGIARVDDLWYHETKVQDAKKAGEQKGTRYRVYKSSNALKTGI